MILHNDELSVAQLAELKAKKEAQAIFAAMSERINSVKSAGKKLQDEVIAARQVMVASYNSEFNGVAEAVRAADGKLVVAARRLQDACAECVQLLDSARHAVDNRDLVNVTLPAAVRLRPHAEAPAFNLGGLALNAGSL